MCVFVWRGGGGSGEAVKGRALSHSSAVTHRHSLNEQTQTGWRLRTRSLAGRIWKKSGVTGVSQQVASKGNSGDQETGGRKLGRRSRSRSLNQNASIFRFYPENQQLRQPWKRIFKKKKTQGKNQQNMHISTYKYTNKYKHTVTIMCSDEISIIYEEIHIYIV